MTTTATPATDKTTARPRNLREIGDRKVRATTIAVVAASLAGTVALTACNSAASSTTTSGTTSTTSSSNTASSNTASSNTGSGTTVSTTSGTSQATTSGS